MADTSFLKDSLSGTVPTEISKEIIKNVIDQASILKVCKREPMMSDTKVLPYLTGSGKASWVNEGEQIDTTLPTFVYPKLNAKKLAVIIPITREKLNDSVTNVMSEMKQAIADTFANAIDSAMIFGTDSPFDTNLITAIGTQTVTATSFMEKNISEAMGIVEKNNFNCSNILMGNTQKVSLRGVVNNAVDNALITLNDAYGVPFEFVRNWNDAQALSITGDFSKAIVGTREGIEYQILDQATIVSGEDTINLAQRDMIAVKATMRLAFVVVEPKAFSMIVASA